MNRRTALTIVLGVLPLLVVHFAYWLNMHAEDALAPVYQCNPYLEGCVSTSRAVRSGPGLIWFKVVMVPYALLLMLYWRKVGKWMTGVSLNLPGSLRPGSARWVLGMGVGGAVALILYTTFLGSDGALYSWLRRYGVVFFFGLTALAQLLVGRFVWEKYRTAMSWSAAFLLVIVAMQWLIGVFAVSKRFLFDDPQLIDRLENTTEWLMIAAMCLGLMLIGVLLQQPNPANERHQ